MTDFVPLGGGQVVVKLHCTLEFKSSCLAHAFVDVFIETCIVLAEVEPSRHGTGAATQHTILDCDSLPTKQFWPISVRQLVHRPTAKLQFSFTVESETKADL
jgi:hypothetical protein